MRQKVFIDYPKTEWGEKLSKFFSRVTYISIAVVTFSSYIKPTDQYFEYVIISEIIFSFFFLVDFIIRLYLSKGSRKFIFNFYTLLDILSILPFFIFSFLNREGFFEVLMIFRAGRVLRLLKVGRYERYMKKFWKAFKDNGYRYNIAIMVFGTLWLIGSFLMYGLEANVNEIFQTIPDAMGWVVAKIFMVGYNSGTPVTQLGIIIGKILLFIGPFFISIMTSTTLVIFLDMAKYVKFDGDEDEEKVCEHCLTPYNQNTDLYCKICGKKHP